MTTEQQQQQQHTCATFRVPPKFRFFLGPPRNNCHFNQHTRALSLPLLLLYYYYISGPKSISEGLDSSEGFHFAADKRGAVGWERARMLLNSKRGGEEGEGGRESEGFRTL